jgi:hypothetical protein
MLGARTQPIRAGSIVGSNIRDLIASAFASEYLDDDRESG